MDKILYLGIDVDDKYYHLTGIAEDVEPLTVKIRAIPAKLIEVLVKWRNKGFEIKSCYESSYIGFSLCRTIQAAGFSCEVIATSLVPEQAGKRVKTDRLDSLKLANYFMKGLLTPIYVPNTSDEALRDLLRGREFVTTQLKKTKQTIIATMKRYGMDYRKSEGTIEVSYWTKKHREWLRKEIANCEIEFLKINIQLLLGLLEHVESVIKVYDTKIETYAELGEYKNKVNALMCYRGISLIAAMVIITEIGDVKRFAKPKFLMSYAGFDIAEYSSGGVERKHHITKMGNKRIRTGLVEACQSARKPPILSKVVRARRKQSKPEQIAIADRCMKRLYTKSTRLLNREKPLGKVKVACAREMVGFVWESLMAC